MIPPEKRVRVPKFKNYELVFGIYREIEAIDPVTVRPLEKWIYLGEQHDVFEVMYSKEQMLAYRSEKSVDIIQLSRCSDRIIVLKVVYSFEEKNLQVIEGEEKIGVIDHDLPHSLQRFLRVGRVVTIMGVMGFQLD
jgi:hypothetical protein